MKNSIAQLWTVIKGIVGIGLAFIGVLFALPCVILYTVGDWVTDLAIKLMPKEVRKDTGKEIIKEIVTE